MGTENNAIPDFLVVGAGKAGTTSIHKYLTLHPDVCMPIKEKELGFWYIFGHEHERPHYKLNPHLPNTYEKYISYFEHKKPGQLCGEVTPAYLPLYYDVIENLQSIHRDWKSVKIIITIREPIDKVWSQYKFVKGLNGFDPEDLDLPQSLVREVERFNDPEWHKGMGYVHDAMYYEKVKGYVTTFPHVHILMFDELKKDPQAVMNGITDFLEIDRLTFTKDDLSVHNASRAVKKPTNFLKKLESSGILRRCPNGLQKLLREKLVTNEVIEPDTMKLLMSKFQPEIEKLDKLVDNDLSPWLAKYEQLKVELDAS